MFRTLREQYGLTKVQVAAATGRSPNYILKCEDLVFPSPPAALIQFYMDLDPTLDKDFLTDWYLEAQHKKRLAFLDDWSPSDTSSANFRQSWVPRYPSYDADADALGLGAPENPTQYALSKGLCIAASVVYHMETHVRPLPEAVSGLMDQLIHYTRSGQFVGDDSDTAYAVTDRLERIKKDFA